MLRRYLDRLYNASLFLAGAFMVGIFLLMVGEAAARKLGGYIPGANDLVGWFCAAAGFLALPATFKRGDMVRVGFALDSLPAPARKPMLLLCLLIALTFVSYMLYAVAGYVWSGWRAEELTQGMLEVPVWIPQASFLVGVVLLLVSIVDEIVTHLLTPADRLHAEKQPSMDDVSMN